MDEIRKQITGNLYDKFEQERRREAMEEQFFTVMIFILVVATIFTLVWLAPEIGERLSETLSPKPV